MPELLTFKTLWLRWKRIHLQCRRPRFDPWVGKIPWRREWLTTPVFLPGEFHGQRSLAATVPGLTESGTTEWLMLTLPGALLMTGMLLYSRFLELIRGFWDGSVVKNLPAVLETSVRRAGWLHSPWGCKELNVTDYHWDALSHSALQDEWSVLWLSAWEHSLTMGYGRSKRYRPGMWGN